MKRINVKVYVESDSSHVTQFYTGLYMLKDQNIITVTLCDGNYKIHNNGIRLTVNELPVFIDLSDNALINLTAYAENKLYFKRMLLKDDVVTKEKLRPYGFNYPVYYKNDRTITRSFYTKNKANIVNAFLRSNQLLSRALNINLSHSTAQVKHFEQAPQPIVDPTVLFSARLWMPDKPKAEEKKVQRHFINVQRIEIVNEGRKRLGEKFIGGIHTGDYAESVAQESLVTANDLSHKRNYLKALREATICIATPGLEDSIGFKFAEYICMSKAIVSSPIDNYVLPGKFEAGKNYLEFDNSAKDCITKCEQLIQDTQLCSYIMENNHDYYNNFLRPDKLVWNLIKQVVND